MYEKFALLAMPQRGPFPLPSPDHLDNVLALAYQRPPNKNTLHLKEIHNLHNQTIPLKNIPRSYRKLSGRGIIEGRYGWPISTYHQSFIDGTIYTPTFSDTTRCTDSFIITQDFVAHGRHTLSHTPILPKINQTRYGTPLYNLDNDAFVLPIYLRFSSKTSAHEKIAQRSRYMAQMKSILNILNVPFSTIPDLTWLSSSNYC